MIPFGTHAKVFLMSGTVALALLAALGWSFARLSDSAAAARAAGQDLAECRALAARIEWLRTRPAVAGAQQVGAADLSRRIEDAAHAADFEDGSIERIEPAPARRVGDSNYREVPTVVRIRRVTLRQVFTFLQALGADSASRTGHSSALSVQSIRLSAPRGEETGDRWTVESTLTYLIFSPKQSGRSAGESAEAG